jgi:hypothetical protein
MTDIRRYYSYHRPKSKSIHRHPSLTDQYVYLVGYLDKRLRHYHLFLETHTFLFTYIVRMNDLI